MADIMMCNNQECKLRHECYRYMSIENPFRQSYGVDLKPDENGKCENQMPIIDGKLNGYLLDGAINYNKP